MLVEYDGLAAHMIVLSAGCAQGTLASRKYHPHILPSTAECAIPPEYSKDVQDDVDFHQRGKEQMVVACRLSLHPQPQQIY